MTQTTQTVSPLRQRMIDDIAKAHAAGQLQFFGEYAGLVETTAFADWLRPLRQIDWVVYAKRPLADPVVSTSWWLNPHLD